MQTVVLVGTAHKFQLPVNGAHADGIAQFRSMILDLCRQQDLAAIAEEMNSHALQENKVTESVAQQVCASLGRRHQFSDPSPEERYKLGIRQDNDIRVEHRSPVASSQSGPTRQCVGLCVAGRRLVKRLGLTYHQSLAYRPSYFWRIHLGNHHSFQQRPTGHPQACA